MKILKKAFKWLLIIVFLPVLYGVIALITTAITVDRDDTGNNFQHTIYLSTNGVHLDIVLPVEETSDDLLKGINLLEGEEYLSFGWGDENFYINTPTWSDLTFSNALRAMFWKSSTLMHVTRHKNPREHWVEINVNQHELEKLNQFIKNSFKLDYQGDKQLLEGEGYSQRDNFYKANGSYSCFNTCNSWANLAFKQSGLTACLWTPFDFGLLNKYDE